MISIQPYFRFISYTAVPVGPAVQASTMNRVHAHMPLWIALTIFLPENTPDWASAASTRNFIDVPFDGVLAPPSEKMSLTRILHHLRE